MITLRGRIQEIRAVVDELCVPFYYHSIVRALWHWRRHFQIQWFTYDERSLHLRLIDPESIRRVGWDEFLVAGDHIAYSEVGYRPLTVDPLVLRLTSGGGIIGFGTERSTLSIVPRWDIEDADDLLVSAVDAALALANIGLEGVDASRGHELRCPEKFLVHLSILKHLPEAFLTRSLTLLAVEDESTRSSLYGVMRALSTAALELPPDMRVKIEGITGRVAPHVDW